MARSTDEKDDCALKLSNGHTYHLENGHSVTYSSKRKRIQKPKYTKSKDSKLVQDILMANDCSHVNQQLKSKPCRRSERKIIPSSLWDNAVINPFFERKRRKLSDSPIKNTIDWSTSNDINANLVERDKTVAFKLNGQSIHETSSQIDEVHSDGILKENNVADCQGHVRLRRSSRKHSSSVSSISDSKYTIKQDNFQKVSSPEHNISSDSSNGTGTTINTVVDILPCDGNKTNCSEINMNGNAYIDIQSSENSNSVVNDESSAKLFDVFLNGQDHNNCEETFKSIDDEIEVKALITKPQMLHNSNKVYDQHGNKEKAQNQSIDNHKSEKHKEIKPNQSDREKEAHESFKNPSNLILSEDVSEDLYTEKVSVNKTEQNHSKGQESYDVFKPKECSSKSNSLHLSDRRNKCDDIRKIDPEISLQESADSNTLVLESCTLDLTVSKDDMKSKEAQQLIDGSSFQRFYKMRTRRQNSSTDDVSGKTSTPVINRRISSRSNSSTSKASDDPNNATSDNRKSRPKQVKPDILCSFCLQTEDERGENMISCCLCGASGHPSCLQFNTALTERVKLYDWECIECKKCELCRNSGDDATLLFCDDCDKGFHMSCLVPPLPGEPDGHWSCLHCVDGSTYWTDKIRKTGGSDKLLKKKSDKASRRKQLLDDLAMFHEAQSRAQSAMNEEAKPTPKAKSSKKKGATVPPTIKSIELGCYEITAWYSSPYPAEYALQSKLYICEFCLKYMKSGVIASRHIAKCPARCPPGDEIYRKDTISVFEVDGRKNKTYCQNLCLLAKLFLDHKTLYYDVEPFLFYILTEYDRKGCHIVGYFSKEKNSFLSYNVSCILVIPPYMKKGYGKMLIDFSYALSRKEGKLGSPEKPLSDLGLVSYRNYWKEKLLEYFLDYNETDITIKSISQTLGFNPYDIVSTLQAYGMIKYHKSNHYVLKRPEMLAAYKKKLAAHAGLPTRSIDMSKLKWIPHSQRDSNQ